MKILTKNPHDSFSFSRRYFNLKGKTENEDDEEEIVTFSSSSLQQDAEIQELTHSMCSISHKIPSKKKKLPIITVSKIRSFLPFIKTKSKFSNSGATKVIVTIFGYPRNRVHIAFQEEPMSNPAFMVELATPTSVLVREMASGEVKIALECEGKKNRGVKLFEERIWRTYCNGKKFGHATSRECGAKEQRILDLVGPVSMGAGMLPGTGGEGGSDGDLMYIRARYERVVRSKEFEAFYMINPDRQSRNELSIYLLRV